MDEFNSAHQNHHPIKHYSLLHMNPNMDLFNNLGLMDQPFNDLFPDHHHHYHQPHLPFNDVAHTDPTFDPTAQMISHSFANGWNNMNLAQDQEIQPNSSPLGSGAGFVGPSKVSKKHQNYGGKKRKRMAEGEMVKPREVVHVRAKRGQATDSHSLAERLRREKINDKLRSLQDLVPGCYKTMGMAVMLDVIINYVRSLQNQIDFLSMKLSAASLYYDFNSSEAEAMESAQGTSGYEAAQGGYGGISHQFQTTDYWPL